MMLIEAEKRRARGTIDGSPMSRFPATAANLSALLVVGFSALIAVGQVRAGVIAFAVLGYALWAVARIANLRFASQKWLPWGVSEFLSAFEKTIYRRFALYIHRPGIAFFFSTTLYWLRFAAIAYLLLALWQGSYIEAAAIVLFIILSSSTITTMYPDLYFEDAAKRGNEGAAQMLSALRHVQGLIR